MLWEQSGVQRRECPSQALGSYSHFRRSLEKPQDLPLLDPDIKLLSTEQYI